MTEAHQQLVGGLEGFGVWGAGGVWRLELTSMLQVDKDRLDLGRINSVYDKFDQRYKSEIKRCLDEVT